MGRRIANLLFVAGLLLVGTPAFAGEDAADGAAAVRKAVAFLSREVPAWPAENNCYSCHNNGDGARTLFRAVELGHTVEDDALSGTAEWLSRPDDWHFEGGDGRDDDEKLAAVQFASTLLAAADAGRFAKQRDSLRLQAARRVAGYQNEDGSWGEPGGGIVGSPVAYGMTLTTVQARSVLVAVDRKQFPEAIAKADRWLRGREPQTVLDAAATLLAVGRAEDAEGVALRTHCLQVLAEGQHKEGGWGPFLISRPEAFDTAVVLLALNGLERTPEWDERLARGRQSLLATQREDGSWTETTRPAGNISYPMWISTTAWATRALLETTPQPAK